MEIKNYINKGFVKTSNNITKYSKEILEEVNTVLESINELPSMFTESDDSAYIVYRNSPDIKGILSLNIADNISSLLLSNPKGFRLGLKECLKASYIANMLLEFDSVDLVDNRQNVRNFTGMDLLLDEGFREDSFVVETKTIRDNLIKIKTYEEIKNTALYESLQTKPDISDEELINESTKYLILTRELLNCFNK